MIDFFYPTIAICLILLGIIKYCNIFDKKTNRLFIFSVISILMVAICDIIVFIIEKKSSSDEAIRYVLFVSDFFRPLSVYFLVLLSTRKSGILKDWVVLIPVIMNTIVILVSIFTGWEYVFYKDITDDMNLLDIIPYVVLNIYMIVLIIHCILEFISRDIANAILILVLIVNTIISADFSLGEKFDAMLCLAMAINISFYYMFLHMLTISRDSLTDAGLRKKLIFDVDNMKKRLTGIIIYDINGLKIINDTEGHNKGDEILKLSSLITRKRLPKYCKLYRLGGDEFLITCRKLSEEGIKEVISDLRSALLEEEISASFGYSLLNSSISVKEAYENADKAMYADKVNMKNNHISQN